MAVIGVSQLNRRVGGTGGVILKPMTREEKELWEAGGGGGDLQSGVSMQFLWFQISTFDKVSIPTTTHFPGN